MKSHIFFWQEKAGVGDMKQNLNFYLERNNSIYYLSIMPWLFFFMILYGIIWNVYNQWEYIFSIWQLNNFVAAKKIISISFLHYIIPYSPHSPLTPWSVTWWTLWKGWALADLNTQWGINYSYPKFVWSPQVLGGLVSQSIP